MPEQWAYQKEVPVSYPDPDGPMMAAWLLLLATAGTDLAAAIINLIATRNL